MSSVHPNVAVVIVNWQRPKDTIECVRSVLAGDLPRVQVLVVDNGSHDDSVDQFKQAIPDISIMASLQKQEFYRRDAENAEKNNEEPSALCVSAVKKDLFAVSSIIPLPENLGFAGGYNAGIQHALAGPATHVFLLNNDTTIEPETIPALLDASWDVAVPKILFYDEPRRIWAAGCRWRSLPPSVAMIGFRRGDAPAYDFPRPLDFATGCALMVKRQVLEKLGGFDADFESYMEDYDFCYRVRQAGFTIGYVPRARILHKGSQTLGEYTSRRWWHQGKNTVLFYRKDNRYTWGALWIFLFWVTLRETIKGHIGILPGFWGGVREGLRFLKQKKANSDGNHEV
jgi:GT2 family glycosyltransferase